MYICGLVAKGDSPTENLGRTCIAVISGISALMKVSSKRRPLQVYGKHFTSDLLNAFEDVPQMREKILGAIRLYDEDKYSKALKILDELKLEAKTKVEHNAVGLFTALCQSELGMHEIAAATYEETIRKGGGTSRIYSNLGFQYDALGQMERAVDAYQKASEMDPENPMLANTLIRVGRYDEAAQAARQALQLSPRLYQASSVVAMACAVQGREEERKTFFDMAVTDGQNAETLARACEIYAVQEKRRMLLETA